MDEAIYSMLRALGYIMSWSQWDGDERKWTQGKDCSENPNICSVYTRYNKGGHMYGDKLVEEHITVDINGYGDSYGDRWNDSTGQVQWGSHMQRDVHSDEEMVELLLEAGERAGRWRTSESFYKEEDDKYAALVAAGKCLPCEGTGYAGPYGDTCTRCEGSGYPID